MNLNKKGWATVLGGVAMLALGGQGFLSAEVVGPEQISEIAIAVYGGIMAIVGAIKVTQKI